MRKIILFAIVLVFGFNFILPFGKNKIQYEDYNWQILETEHFLIHFYEKEKDLAWEVVPIAEEAYEKLSSYLGHEIDYKVPVILYSSHSDFSATNVIDSRIGEGTLAFSELLKDRLVIPYSGSSSDMKHVFTHELVHIFQFNIYFKGIPKALLNNPFAITIPLWVMEGMAEFLSVGWNTEAETWLRDATVSGYLIPVQYLDNVGGYLLYKQGQAFYHFVNETWGKEKVLEFIYSFRMSKSIDNVAQKVFGMDMERLNELYARFYKRIYWPDLKDKEFMDSFAKRLTNHKKSDANFSIKPSISPDGQRMAFFSNKNIYIDLFTASPQDGSNVEKIARSNRTAEIESFKSFSSSTTWSPDSKQIAFIVFSQGNEWIYIHDFEKDEIIKRIKLPVEAAYNVRWSNNGKYIAFNGLKNAKSALYIVNIENDDIKILLNDFLTENEPVWSDDDSEIYFTTNMFYPQEADSLLNYFYKWEVGKINLETEKITQITKFKSQIMNPRIADGYLYFISDMNGVHDIYAMDLASKELKQVTKVISNIYSFDIEPTGENLVFSGLTEGGYDLFSFYKPLEYKPRFENESEIVDKIKTKLDSLEARVAKFEKLNEFIDDEKTVLKNDSLFSNIDTTKTYVKSKNIDDYSNENKPDSLVNNDADNSSSEKSASQNRIAYQTDNTNKSDSLTENINNNIEKYSSAIEDTSKEDDSLKGNSSKINDSAPEKDNKTDNYSTRKIDPLEKENPQENETAIKNSADSLDLTAQKKEEESKSDVSESDKKRMEFTEIVFEDKKDKKTSENEEELFLPKNEKEEKSSTERDTMMTPRVRPYRTRFTPDAMAGSVSYLSTYGMSGSLYIRFSDILGDNKFVIVSNIANRLEESDLYFEYAYLPKRIDYNFGALHIKDYFHSNRTRFGEYFEEEEYYSERMYGGFFNISYPLSVYNRLEFNFNALQVEREMYMDNDWNDPDSIVVKNTMIMPEFSYVYDNTIWGYTAPISGMRFNFNFLTAPEFLGNDLKFDSYFFDFRSYFNLNIRYSFALRFAGGISTGRDAMHFFLGGPTNLRGFNQNSIAGNKFGLASAEFRYPFIDYLIFQFPLPLYFQQIGGVIFTDWGAVWDDDFVGMQDGVLRDIKMDYGFGMRMIAGYFLLKFDIAWKSDFQGSSKPKYVFSIGTNF